MSSILLATGKSSSQGKIFNEGDHLQPWFKIQELEVAREFTRQSPECSDVLEKVIVYRLLETRIKLTSFNSITRYLWRSKSGKIVDSLLNVFVKEKKELKMGDGPGLEYWPELNCMDQDDPRLIEHIRSHQLRPPSLEASTMNQTYYGSEVEVCFLCFTSVF